MKLLIACDKFRGSLTARDANAALERALAHSHLVGEARSVPLADGGEGTLDALMSPTSEVISSPARNPFGTWVKARWAYDPQRGRAVIEMAAIAGHDEARDCGYDPDRATSAGVGDLIAAALDRGAREVVVALGGSITVDGGAGALWALGARYSDSAGADIACPAGRALTRVASVDLTELDPRAKSLAIIIAADVDNLLVGPRGAAAVFGPQKGVNPSDVAAFDDALAHFDAVVAAACNRATFADTPFAGAAGGMMSGLSAIAKTRAQDGFQIVCDHHGLEAEVGNADLVVTGEGSLDQQSLGGKGPVALARMAAAAGVPAIAFAGRLAVSPEALAQNGIRAAFPIGRAPQSLEAALLGADDALTEAATHAFNLLALTR